MTEPVLEVETTSEVAASGGSRGFRLARSLGVHDAGRALGDFVTYLPTKILPAVAGFLALPLVARRLQPADLGVLAIAQTLISLGWIWAGQWLTSTITRELPAAWARRETDDFDEHLRAGLGVTAVLFVGFVAFLGIGAVISAALVHSFLLIVAASLGLILQNVAITLFQNTLRPGAYMAVELSSRVIGIAAGVALVYAGYGVPGYLAGVAVASLVIGAAGLRAGWPGPVRGEASSWREIRPWLLYGVPASISGVAMWALLFVDRYLLSLLRSTKEVGVYTLGGVLGDRPVSLPLLAFTVASRPLLMRAFDEEGRGAAERLLRSHTRLVVLLTVPIVAFLAAGRHPLLGLLVGTRQSVLYYGTAAKVVPIIAFASFLGVLAFFSSMGLLVERMTRHLVYAALVGLGVNVAANLVLIPLYGILGAAIAAPIGMGAYLAANQFWSSRQLTWRFPFATLMRTIVASAAGVAASIPVARASGWYGIQAALPEIGVLGIIGLLGGTVYVLALWFLGERRA
jgi:O-antigen/teichoic acid export membrane protein